jgi:dTDP-4-dehydrorhamnose 3,5-epimerase
VKVHETALPGVLVLEPRVYRDERGLFLEQFRADRFAEHRHLGLPASIVQLNHSRSVRGVLRGLHYQLRRPQGKLISVIHGDIYDVAVDIRVGSPTFGKSTALHLCGDQPRAVWIPPGFAHGFCVLSETADVVYGCTDVYAPGDEYGVHWSDESLRIDWPVTDPILSEKDRVLAPLDPSRADLPRYEG